MLSLRKSVVGLIGAAAAVTLIGTLFAAVPAAAAKGDIWTQPAGSPEETSGHSQEVHLPMGSVDIWGDDLDKGAGTWVLYHMPPPNPPAPDTEISRGTYSYSGTGSKVIATIPAATFAAAPGPHFKVEVDNESTKSKTFWIESNTQISTAANPSGAVVGGLLKDTAVLEGGIVPTGTITFTLRDPANAVAHTETVTANGDGSYPTPTGHAADSVGTWQWQASYSGDGGNAATTSRLGDEPVVVSKASPTIATTPAPTAASVGANLNDSALLQGGFNPTGTITFTLYDPSNSPTHTETANVSGNSSYATSTGHIAVTAGTWHWKAEYSGDANNNPVASLTTDEPVTVTAGEENIRVQPVITTTPNPKSTSLGATLKDTAMLSGGNSPTGSITFTLYDPNGTAVHTEQVTVFGNGTYQTPAGHVAASQGTWHWKAQYGGDTSNFPASSNAADEPVVVGPTGGVLASTGQTSPAEGLAAGLMAAGLVAMLVALVRRRREA